MAAMTGVPSPTGAGSMPSAMSSLGLSQSMTPEEIQQRKKKLMAAGNGANSMSQFGDTAFAMLGLNPSSAQ